MQEFGDALTGGGAPTALPAWVHWSIALLLVVGVAAILFRRRLPAPGAVAAWSAGLLAKLRVPAATLLRGATIRLGLLLSGLTAGLLLAEVSLQTIAFARRMVTPAPSARAPGARPVLAVGDSNTYGLYLSPGEEPYPSLLEQIWNARHAEQVVEVVNLGYPGTNSSLLLDALPDFLARLHPGVVTIMVGVNDFWTEPVTQTGANGSSLRRWSRVYPLLFMLVRWVGSRFADPANPAIVKGTGAFVGDRFFPLGIKARGVPTEDWVVPLEMNLEEMVVLVRDAGAEPVLLTYPGAAPWYSVTVADIRAGAYPESAPFYMKANQAIRGAAHVVGARLIDVDAAFRARCPSADCGELLFPDLHPRAEGHRIVAETLLAGWDGWGPAESPGTSEAPPATRRLAGP